MPVDGTIYGHTTSQWAMAKGEMKAVLIKRARAKKPISYSELVGTVHAVRFEPNDYALAAMLGEISTEENHFGRGMLSVLVVHKDGEHQPGNGFFELAASLGWDTTDKTVFWIAELNKVCDFWNSHLA